MGQRPPRVRVASRRKSDVRRFDAATPARIRRTVGAGRAPGVPLDASGRVVRTSVSTALQQGLDEHQRRVVVLHQQHVQLVLARGVGERRDGRRVVRLRIGIGRARGGCHGGRSRDRARRHLRTVTSVPPRERRLTRAVARGASARFRPGRAVRSKRRRDGRCRAKAVIRALAPRRHTRPTPVTRAPVLGHGPLVYA